MLATVHQLQKSGHFLNGELEDRLRYLREKFSFEIILEEWSKNQSPSFAADYANKLHLKWQDIGTSKEEQFSTYTNPINHPGHDGTLDSDPDAPELSEYGPYERQENREKQMLKNIQEKMGNHEVGLLIVGIAHLHSLFGKLESNGFKTTAYNWLTIRTQNR
jgi:hypothetical protein